MVCVLIGLDVAPLDCGSYSTFSAPSFTPAAAASHEIRVWNQLTIDINVHQVTSPGQTPHQRFTLPAGSWTGRNSNTAGLWFVTDSANIDILPLSVDACYYVMGTSDALIITA